MSTALILLTLAAQCAWPASAATDDGGGMFLLYRGGFDAALLNRRSSGNASDGDTEVRIGHFDGLVRRQGCDPDETVCPGK